MTKEEVLEKCAPAFAELQRSVVGLFLRMDSHAAILGNHHESAIGEARTGYLVVRQGQYFIATCGHCLENPREIWVYLGVAAEIFRLGELVENLEDDVVSEYGGNDGRGIDLGYVRLSHPEKIIAAGKSFRPADNVCPALKEVNFGATCFLQGFPGRLVWNSHLIDLSAEELLVAQKVVLLTIPLFGIDSVGQFRLRCKLEAKREGEEEMFDARGCSGGPLFCLANPAGLEGDSGGFAWIGISSTQTSAGEEPRYLYFQHAERWVELVDHVGELPAFPGEDSAETDGLIT